jgi:hypothetical protein
MRSIVRRPGGRSMVRRIPSVALACLGFGIATPVVAQGAQKAASAQDTSWAAVETTLGRKGTPQPGGVIRFAFPRGDLQVTSHGVPVKPAFALGSWVAFRRGADLAVAMGDLVLLEGEVNPVLQRLLQDGVYATALHNHLALESPHVMYMHIHGAGDPVKVAATIKAALTLSKTPLGPPPAATPPPLALDTVQIASILGIAGKGNGGVYQVNVPRKETITDEGMELLPSMGVATAINFQPTGPGKAAITGDFVMVAGEVPLVMRALRDNGIDVVSVHSHLLSESPRLFFMHFWANDDAIKLARGLRQAIDKLGAGGR